MLTGGVRIQGGDGEGLDNTSCQGVAVLVNAHTYKGGLARVCRRVFWEGRTLLIFLGNAVENLRGVNKNLSRRFLEGLLFLK